MTGIPRMKTGGMGAQCFAVYVAASYAEGNRAANRSVQTIDTVRRDIIARYPNDLVHATTAEDIRRVHAHGKIAALLGIEGGHAIDALSASRLCLRRTKVPAIFCWAMAPREAAARRPTRPADPARTASVCCATTSISGCATCRSRIP